jgi:hypothetical protein
MSVAVIDSLNLMKASFEEEAVLTSALAVPAHQALQCRIETYGNPFKCAPSKLFCSKGSLLLLYHIYAANTRFSAICASPTA